ncbi:MAG: alkaline phosphatase [Thermodesulfobacteriota bacterium]
MKKVWKISGTAALGITALLLAGQAHAGAMGGKAKNIILMISDGQGFNTVRATRFYTGSKAVYEGADFVKVAMQTNSANNPEGYQPARMAADFTYSTSGATDSASAATAMYSGMKNHDGDINWSTTETAMVSFFEQQARAGRSIGAVSSVHFSHATPAAVYGHNSSRNNYAALACEGIYGANPLDGSVADSGDDPLAGSNNLYDAMNYQGKLKVLMGAGHGDYDNDGVLNPDMPDLYVGGSTAWTDIKDDAAPNGWTLVEEKAAFEAIAAGASNPDKVLGVARVNATLQQSRTDAEGDFDPVNTTVPTLATMTRAALNVLDNDPWGFAVMIEGGAVDWANHANQLDRMIEEQMDFNASVQAVVAYLDAGTSGNNWENTLLIVTADHETGHLWGDGSGSFFDVNRNGVYDAGVDYAHVVDHGAGHLPGATFNSGDHTNALVPLYARGAGAELFLGRLIGTDAGLVNLYGISDAGFDGAYIDNTSVYYVMVEAAAGRKGDTAGKKK